MCNVTHSFETKNVCLDVKEPELNEAFVHVCHSLSMLKAYISVLIRFWNSSVPCQQSVDIGLHAAICFSAVILTQ